MTIVEKNNKRTGLVTTVLFHLALLLLFAFFGMSYMVPPPEEEGITINFGYTDAGKNNLESETPAEENTPVTETATAEPTPQEVVEEEVMTQETEEAPAIVKKKEPKKEEVKKPKKEEPKPDKKASEALNNWKNAKNSKSGGGDGNSNEMGNQGDINGDKNSKNYDGGGNGNGISYNLSGRNMLSSPSIKDNSQEEGKVVVDIIVDKYGKVIRATPGARGSTTANSILYKKAKEAAMETRFNANPDVAEEQKGQMTFIFILN